MGLLKSEELLIHSLENFGDMLKYIPEKLSVYLKEIEKDENLKNYRIEVHALKSTAATVGALLLSKIARLLEVAAIHGEITKIRTLHPILVEEIEKHKERVAIMFPQKKLEIEDKTLVESYLEMLSNGLLQEDYDTADFIMEELKKYQYPEKVGILMDGLVGQILNMETDSAMDTIEKIMVML